MYGREKPLGCVLVIDDEPDIRKVVRLSLEKAGYRIFEATDGMEAMKLLTRVEDQCLIEAIITEIHLPTINGVEALSYFQQEYPNIPIIILTAHLDVDIRSLFMRHAIVDCLFKPVEGDRLKTTVARAIAQHQLSRI